MDIKEAIKLMDERLDQIYRDVEFVHPNQIEHMEAEIEALSIVIESTKTADKKRREFDLMKVFIYSHSNYEREFGVWKEQIKNFTKYKED